MQKYYELYIRVSNLTNHGISGPLIDQFIYFICAYFICAAFAILMIGYFMRSKAVSLSEARLVRHE